MLKTLRFLILGYGADFRRSRLVCSFAYTFHFFREAEKKRDLVYDDLKLEKCIRFRVGISNHVRVTILSFLEFP